MINYIKADEKLALVKSNWPNNYEHINQFAFYLNRVYYLSHLQIENILKSNNLSISEFDILASLRSSTKPYVLSPTELQYSMLITSGGLTKLLYQLEARQLISRSVQAQDKRSKLVHLSPKGCKLIEKTMDCVLEHEDKWISKTLSENEIEELNSLLSKLNSRLESRLLK